MTEPGLSFKAVDDVVYSSMKTLVKIYKLGEMVEMLEDILRELEKISKVSFVRSGTSTLLHILTRRFAPRPSLLVLRFTTSSQGRP